ncbi:MAG: hypothetical protein PHT07_10140 [Paludibacter sp.]|nr:hypothetical protein [Paludibacter sp.]
MGFYKNRVTDFNRKGVPDNIAIILKLSVELKGKGVDPIEIIRKIKSGDAQDSMSGENND